MCAGRGFVVATEREDAHDEEAMGVVCERLIGEMAGRELG